MWPSCVHRSAPSVSHRRPCVNYSAGGASSVSGNCLPSPRHNSHRCATTAAAPTFATATVLSRSQEFPVPTGLPRDGQREPTRRTVRQAQGSRCDAHGTPPSPARPRHTGLANDRTENPVAMSAEIAPDSATCEVVFLSPWVAIIYLHGCG